MKRVRPAIPRSHEPPRDGAEIARRMARALAYLMEVSSAAGLPRVTAKLAIAQAELLIVSGQPITDTEPQEARNDSPRHRH